MSSSRAEEILQQIYELSPLLLSPVIVGASIASQQALARRRTKEKIQQAGMGAEHQKAKAQLHATRMKQVRRLGLSGNLSGQIKAQKAKVKDIENRGLHKFATTLGQNPQQKEQERRAELSQ